MIQPNISNIQKRSRELPSFGNDNVRSISVPNSKLVMTYLSKKSPKPFSIITNSWRKPKNTSVRNFFSKWNLRPESKQTEMFPAR